MRSVFRVWHLEDDEGDRTFLDRAMKRLHRAIQLEQFPTPQPAIARLQAIVHPRTELPHLVISDLKMPGMTGVEFVQWVRSSPYCYVPVVILSGSGLPEDVLHAHEVGVTSFVTKPLNASDLTALLHTVVEYWRDVCHSPVDYKPDPSS
jgi:CheY-like chemotaxis protein